MTFLNALDEEDVCILPADAGSCQNETNSMRRYFYDIRRGTCLEFAYSGCGGNLNSFDDYQSCMAYCRKFFTSAIEID